MYCVYRYAIVTIDCYSQAVHLKLAFVLTLFAAVSPGFDRDWNAHPAVVRMTSAADLYAVGDAHSDYVHLCRLLHAAAIISEIPDLPQHVRWSAGRAVLVSTGDMVDKGPRALDVLRLYQSLRDRARESGGDVVILAGNHEAEFLADPAAPKGLEFARQLRDAGIDPADVTACRTWVGELLCNLPFAARVNDWFFSHAGQTNGRTLDRLDSDLRLGIELNGFRTGVIQDRNSPLQGRPSGEGMQWFDSGLPAQGEKTLLRSWAEALGASHIVQGHEPSEIHFADGLIRRRGELFQRYGLIFLIDTGMSAGVGYSEGALLHVRTGTQQATAICAVGGETGIWDGAADSPVGRAPVCGR
jgi:hypothetical protein